MSITASYRLVQHGASDDPRTPWDVGQMATKTGRKYPTQAELRDESRVRIIEMVRGHEPRSGRMEAYRIVGRVIRWTDDKVRKLVADRPVSVSASDYFAIAEAHQSFVDKMAAQAIQRQKRAASAMEELHALRTGDARPGDQHGRLCSGGVDSLDREVAP